MSHPGGMRMEKILPFLPRVLCWLPGARPRPLPEAAAYPGAAGAVPRPEPTAFKQQGSPGRPEDAGHQQVKKVMREVYKKNRGKPGGVQREEMVWTKPVAIPSSLKAGRPAAISLPLSDVVAKACSCAETITPSTVYTIMPFPLFSALTEGPTQYHLPISPLHWGSCVLL